MPRPSKYPDAAAKQAAYRARQQDRLNALLKGEAPPPPAIGNMPAEARWTQQRQQAAQLLTQVRDEMQGYFDERSDQWRDNERGQVMQERITALDDLITELEGLE